MFEADSRTVAACYYLIALIVAIAAVWASSQAWDLAHWNEPWNQSWAIVKRGCRWVRRQWRAFR